MFKRFFVQVLKHKKFSIGIPLVLLPIYIHNIDKTTPIIYNYDERVKLIFHFIEIYQYKR